MRDKASRRGAVDLGMTLMILAFIAMAGFLYWLYQQSAAEKALRIQEAEEAAAAAAALEEMGTEVTGEDLQMNPAQYEGQKIYVSDLPVASMLGQQGFWLELPNQNPFLVSLSEAVKAEGLDIQAGMKPTVSGVVHAMSDSVLNAWTESGSIGEGDRLAAEFATHFLEAEKVLLPDGATMGGAGAGGPGGPGGESGGEGGP
ncbi:MAG: hypothetical protein ACE5GJ_03165 [Gemmatimonadota bacterium]